MGDDEEVFFGSSEPETRPAYTLSDINKAKARCRHCPVFEQCIRQAIRNREQYGVWAGTTMKQRAAIFRRINQGLTTVEEVVRTIVANKDLVTQ